VKGTVETPSDYAGVVFIPFDAGWRVNLAKEMEGGGIEIDWNAVMIS
jgi:hypothetical protein